MSARVSRYACERCQRPTPKKRLAATAVGNLCPRCVEHLPRRLRKKEDNDA